MTRIIHWGQERGTERRCASGATAAAGRRGEARRRVVFPRLQGLQPKPNYRQKVRGRLQVLTVLGFGRSCRAGCSAATSGGEDGAELGEVALQGVLRLLELVIWSARVL